MIKLESFKISKLLLETGSYLKKNEVPDIIVTIIFYGFIAYFVGYQIGKLHSHISNFLF
ncbi:MAG: hypothetical protein ACQEP9_09880 [Bacillota bacterium]